MGEGKQTLREYKYLVNGMETTALLTEDMAEKLGAVGVGEQLNAEDAGWAQSQRHHGSSRMAAVAESGGVEGDAVVEPRRAQQQGVDEQGRTASMRPPKSAEPAPRKAAAKSHTPQDK